MQGIGPSNDGVRSDIVPKLWKEMMQLIMLYPTQCLWISKTDLKDMDKTQAKLVKAALGLVKYYWSTPLMNYMHINRVSKIRNIYSLDLLTNMLFSKSKATFYNFLLQSDVQDSNKSSLVLIVKCMCSFNNIQFML